jgi:hypothetical protein
MNEAALAHWGLSCQNKQKNILPLPIFLSPIWITLFP